jgi:predicted lipoprotein
VRKTKLQGKTMRKFHTMILVIVFILLFVVPAGAQEATPPPDFTRAAMLQNITENWILPLHEQFRDDTAALLEAAAAFRDDPTEETLTALQRKWRQTSIWWQGVAVFRLGEEAFAIHNRIANDSPIATPVIDMFVTGSDPITAESIGVFGSNVLGIRTIEYLIFDRTGGNATVLEKFTAPETGARRLDYLMVAAEDLAEAGAALWDYWSPEGGNYAAEFTTHEAVPEQEAVSMLANRIIDSHEAMINMRVGWPLGVLSGRVQPEIVEAPYSGASTMQLIATFDMVKTAFTGGDDLGFDDYLNFLGATYEDGTLTQAILAQMDVIDAALDALGAPLDEVLATNPELAQTVYDEGRKLVVLLKADMASRLGITTTPSDNDGD